MRAKAVVPAHDLKALEGVEVWCPHCGATMEARIGADEHAVQLSFECPIDGPSGHSDVVVKNLMEPPAPEEDLYAESAWPTQQGGQQ